MAMHVSLWTGKRPCAETRVESLTKRKSPLSVLVVSVFRICATLHIWGIAGVKVIVYHLILLCNGVPARKELEVNET